MRTTTKKVAANKPTVSSLFSREDTNQVSVLNKWCVKKLTSNGFFYEMLYYHSFFFQKQKTEVHWRFCRTQTNEALVRNKFAKKLYTAREILMTFLIRFRVFCDATGKSESVLELTIENIKIQFMSNWKNNGFSKFKHNKDITILNNSHQ